MKKEMRKQIITARMGQSDSEIVEKSARISEKVKSLLEFQKADMVMFYIDFRKEVATGELIKYSLEQGKRVAVPITDTKEIRLIPSEIKDFPGDVTEGNWGILEPKPECVRPVKPGEIDFVIVPGVSFDEKGNRLGYGGGYYDRFLPQTKQGATFAALAFEMQIREDVCPEEHDCPVHYVITEDRIMKCR